MARSKRRKVFIVRIIHSLADYGPDAERLRALWIKEIGLEALEKTQAEILGYWGLIRKQVFARIRKFSGMVIYQDALPVATREQARKYFDINLIKDRPQSPNFLLIQDLLAKGAVLEGTESFDLVIEQLTLDGLLAKARTEEDVERILGETKVRAMQIMKQRDQFIARRIRDTLPEGERAILFIGAKHNVVAELQELEGTDDMDIINLS